MSKTAGEWISKMEGLVAMWEKQAATAEKVGHLTMLDEKMSVSQLFCVDIIRC